MMNLTIGLLGIIQQKIPFLADWKPGITTQSFIEIAGTIGIDEELVPASFVEEIAKNENIRDYDGVMNIWQFNKDGIIAERDPRLTRRITVRRLIEDGATGMIIERWYVRGGVVDRQVHQIYRLPIEEITRQNQQFAEQMALALK